MTSWRYWPLTWCHEQLVQSIDSYSETQTKISHSNNRVIKRTDLKSNATCLEAKYFTNMVIERNDGIIRKVVLHAPKTTIPPMYLLEKTFAQEPKSFPIYLCGELTYFLGILYYWSHCKSFFPFLLLKNQVSN